MNLPLASPELYDLELDADESYDVAAQHPEIVAEIRGRVDRLIAGFPQQVQDAYLATKSRQVTATPAAAPPRLAR